jgi:hypothetical protein
MCTVHFTDMVVFFGGGGTSEWESSTENHPRMCTSLFFGGISTLLENIINKNIILFHE